MIAEVKLSELCPKVETALMYIGWSLLALFVFSLFLILLLRYSQVWRKFCCNEGILTTGNLEMSPMESEEERQYDAFISFSHKDEDFVTRELIPQLGKPGENGLPEYRLCLHFRDW